MGELGVYANQPRPCCRAHTRPNERTQTGRLKMSTSQGRPSEVEKESGMRSVGSAAPLVLASDVT